MQPIQNNLCTPFMKLSTILSRRQILQVRQRPIENIAITTVRVAVTVLPDRLERPSTWNSPRSSGTVSGQNQRRLRREGVGVSGASDPPIICGIDHRPPSRLGMIRIHEICDPIHHGCFTQPMTCPALGRAAVLHVKHTGQGSPVTGPAAAVSEEVGCLGGARA